MRIAFYDTHKYESDIFDEVNAKYKFDIEYYDFRLNESTCLSAKGFSVVCVFVNDILNKAVIDELSTYGVKMIAFRCSGVNNIDLERANQKNITVVRHIINNGSVNLLKKNCILVNTSHGALVDTKALINALKQKRLQEQRLMFTRRKMITFFRIGPKR